MQDVVVIVLGALAIICGIIEEARANGHSWAGVGVILSGVAVILLAHKF